MKKLPKPKIEKLKNYFEENIKDDGVGSIDERVNSIIRQTCWLCAVVAVFPLPVADIYFLTSIQFIMALRIGEIYGVEIDRKELAHIAKSLGLTLVLGYAAQQMALLLYRTVLPGFGAVTTVPLVYSLTFAIGKILHKYFEMDSKGEAFSGVNFKELWESLKVEGKVLGGKLNIDELKEESKKIYNMIKKST